MDDDLGVAGGAGRRCTRLVREGNKAARPTATPTRVRANARPRCAAMLGVLGLDPLAEPWASRSAGATDGRRGVVDALVAGAARAARRRPGRARTSPPPTRSATSCAAAGVEVEDTPQGPRWTVLTQLMAGNSKRQGAIRKRAGRQPDRRLRWSASQGARGQGPDAEGDATARGTRRTSAPSGRQAAPSAPRRVGRRRPQAAAATSEWVAGRNPVRRGAAGQASRSRRCTSPSRPSATTGCARRSSSRPSRGVSMLEVTRAELDRLTDGAVHQGLALKVPAVRVRRPGRPARRCARRRPSRR